MGTARLWSILILKETSKMLDWVLKRPVPLPVKAGQIEQLRYTYPSGRLMKLGNVSPIPRDLLDSRASLSFSTKGEGIAEVKAEEHSVGS